MCARFDPVTRPERFKEVFGTALPQVHAMSPAQAFVVARQKGVNGATGAEVFPTQMAPIIRATREGLMAGDAAAPDAEMPHHETVWACFGLVPS